MKTKSTTKKALSLESVNPLRNLLNNRTVYTDFCSDIQSNRAWI